MPLCCHSVRNSFKSRFDDFIIYSKGADILLEVIDKFLSACHQYNINPSANKRRFFQTKVKLCGRVSDANGSQLDFRNIQPIRNMKCPVTTDGHCQSLHCCRWTSSCIPNFHAISQPPSDLLEAAYKACGKRRKGAFKRLPSKAFLRPNK